MPNPPPLPFAEPARAPVHAQLPPPGWSGEAWTGERTEPEVNLMEYAVLVWARRWVVLAVVLTTVVLAGAWAFTRPRLYRSTAKVAITIPPQMGGSQADPTLNVWNIDRYIQDQLQVLTTRALAQRVARRLGIEGSSDASGQAALVLLGMLYVQPIKDTNVISISMVGPRAEQTAEWLNLYVSEYIAANIEDGLERSRQVYEVIQSRLAPLREQLIKSEAVLVQFREREDALFFADQSKNVISEQVNTLTSEYAQAKADRIRLETKLNALRELRASSLSETSFPEVLADTTIQGLRKQRNDIEVELSEKLRTLKEGHPAIKELRSRLAGVDARVRDEIATIRRSLETDFSIASGREQSLFDNIQQLKEQSIELSKQTLEYDRLKRDYDQSKAFLEDMLARSKEADISSSASLNNLRVIEPAVPARAPFSPNIPRAIQLALVLGLLLGVALVVGLDYLDHTIRTPEQGERHLGLEVLAALPKLTEDNARVMREVFQSLRTALMLAARGEGCQVLLVTSAVPGEGKTTVVFNLGKVLATGGARVLLLDGDLRKPRLHRLINSKNSRGLTSVVLGENELSEVVQAVADVPSLDVVCSGPLPPNPPELYGKASFRKLLDQVRHQYDWVIVDTPPVGSVTDPVICASMADMALLIVQYGHARRQLIRDGVRQLARSGVRMAGILLNKVDVSRDHYYYSYYYSYYSRYGYGEEVAEVTRKRRKTAKTDRSERVQKAGPAR